MNSYLDLIIQENLSIRNVMKELNSTAKRILFVVDDQKRFLGTISDGDIRRWILNRGKLNALAKDVANSDAFSILHPIDVKKVSTQMKEMAIEYVPILNETGQVVEVFHGETSYPIIVNDDIVKKYGVVIVIMAGGKGARLDPFTKILPKPLIPIGNKTILEIIIEKFCDFGANKFYVSVNYKAGIIKSYFEDLKPDYTIEYINENKPLGTAGALYKIKSMVKKPVIVTNCDIIIDSDYGEIVKHHLREKNDLTVIASVKNYHIPYGICEIANGGKLVRIREKPEYEFIVNTGMYVLSPEVIQLIPDDEFFHMTDLIEKVDQFGKKTGVYPIGEDAWIDTGEWDAYHDTIRKFKR